MDRIQAEQLLKTALADTTVTFRDGQWEAIDALVNQNQKLLVVQRTGWGKSSVYFISTKILRDRGKGPTLIVSPLLALMRNQVDAATRLGLKAVRWDSTNKDEKPEILRRLGDNEIDVLFVHPKQFSSQNFLDNVFSLISDNLGLMVVDEAHCISDWGHDFIPEYRLIASMLRGLPENTGVLGTTATANNRVVDDVKSQLGNIQIHRGPLNRESLSLQTQILPDQPSRLAWLAQTIPTLPGTGIVYALKTRDAEQVADWLNANGVTAKAYYGNVKNEGFENSNEYREYLEDLLMHNDIKVLVATTALGMGYDKPDLGFVIHYQAPSSIVSYYQQVGRAGRGIESSVGVLLSGKEDQKIHRFFREAAFPSEKQVNEVLQILDGSDGLSINSIAEQSNLRHGQIDKVLNLLSVEPSPPVMKFETQWRRVAVQYAMDHERINHLTGQREQEWLQLQNYLSADMCKMTYLRLALDDKNSRPCGKCDFCLGKPLISTSIDSELAHQAAIFLKEAEINIKPKKQISKAEHAFPIYQLPTNLNKNNLMAEEGRALSRWLDAGWGQLVEDCKLNNHFTDDIVDATAEMIEQRWKPTIKPTWVCCVPSLNQINLVSDFASRLAIKLKIPFHNIVTKVAITEPQKQQRNSFHQCKNLDGAFAIEEPIPEGPVLLIDDVINSGWTFTIIAALLRRAGSKAVLPVALASTSVKD
ncbi:RecQ family ATP-dependent DNA helicase [Pseudoalteromonas issachenkonii]|uniref:DNA 3'-5' helicase n=1 Tax=Pseudoalteromonas issachenkonii TaxID=152297 RepID=A0ABU9H5V7_9GAMM